MIKIVLDMTGDVKSTTVNIIGECKKIFKLKKKPHFFNILGKLVSVAAGKKEEF